MKLISDRLFWGVLYISVLISVILILVELQNVRSINDRQLLHDNQRATKSDLEHLKRDIGYMRAIVEEAVKRDRGRQQAREEAKK